ncbi:hypothetical protein M9H77_12311 [Catharanthus roseus]|uniref:Uncharacterized protein n=1 Tax=Catharanthus roseus TaxID=4058 RepID=A0ACC0BH15_CATRO|nr:hypothetical protein M9H77_12311 [Catharanthus roseus]
MLEIVLKETFSPLAYSNIIKELKSTIGVSVTKDHLKSQIRTQKERFNEYYDILKNGRLSSFAWNPITKLWTAEPEVWEDLLRENPLAEKWKNKPISNYESMDEPFAKDRATGEGATTAKEKRKRWENKENGQQVNSIDEIDHLVSQNVIELEEFAATPRRMNEHPKNIAAQQQKKSDRQSGKKRKMSNDEEFDVLKGALHTVAELIREGNSVMEMSRSHVYQLVVIGIESQIIDYCYIYLTQNAD